MERQATLRSSDGKVTGMRKCKRCGASTTPDREPCLKLSTRTTLHFGDRVSIAALRPGVQRDKGEFRYSETGIHGRYAAVLTESGWRFAYPDKLRKVKH